VKLLFCLKETYSQVMTIDFGEEHTALGDLISILKEIRSEYKTLSENYFEVLISKQKRRDSKRFSNSGYREMFIGCKSELLKILFHEDFDKMPLFLNSKLSGHIAKVRLRIGR
jgi:hypothetical protein